MVSQPSLSEGAGPADWTAAVAQVAKAPQEVVRADPAAPDLTRTPAVSVDLASSAGAARSIQL